MTLFKIAVILLAFAGSIHSKKSAPEAPKVVYQSQCCPKDKTACYSLPTYCSDDTSCKHNVASYQCDAAGGLCVPSGGRARADNYHQCGYSHCPGEFKCVTIVQNSAQTESLAEGAPGSGITYIPSSIPKGDD